jgi:hypothetical protein
VARIKQFITAKKILTLPDPDRCQVIEMPEFQRGFSAAYLNPAPPFDPTAPSLYAVSPPPADWPAERRIAFQREYNRAMLQILTIHEAYPGHYVQLEYSNRHPSLIRRVLSSGVFAEALLQRRVHRVRKMKQQVMAEFSPRDLLQRKLEPIPRFVSVRGCRRVG